MKKRVAAFIAIALLLVFAGVIAVTSPPKLLSVIDGFAGGGSGTQRAGTAVAFGKHGQTLDVWRPAEQSAKPRPAIVFFHGGGWVKGDRDAYAFVGRAFASRGYTVVIPDYRKVPDVRFPAFIEDGAEAVRWTRENIAQFGGDPDRIALAGHSAGAHTAVTLALDPRWLTAAGVEPDAVKAAIGLSGPYDFYPFDKKRSIDGGSPVQYGESDGKAARTGCTGRVGELRRSQSRGSGDGALQGVSEQGTGPRSQRDLPEAGDVILPA